LGVIALLRRVMRREIFGLATANGDIFCRVRLQLASPCGEEKHLVRQRRDEVSSRVFKRLGGIMQSGTLSR
jgi:hypothetical protein